MKKVQSLLVLLALGMVFICLATSAWGRQQTQTSPMGEDLQNPSSFTVADNKTDAGGKEAVYSALIDRYAARCEYKSTLRHSRSPKLRQKAEISCLKAAYVKNYKEKIIDTLIERDIMPKMYQVQYAINSMFYNLIRGEVTIAQR